MSDTSGERRVLALKAKGRPTDETQRELWQALRRAFIADIRAKTAVVKLIEEAYPVPK